MSHSLCPQSRMNVGVAHSEVNPNTRVMNSRGIWLTYALGVGILHIVLLSIPFFSVPVVWTLTNVIHNLVINTSEVERSWAVKLPPLSLCSFLFFLVNFYTIWRRTCKLLRKFRSFLAVYDTVAMIRNIAILQSGLPVYFKIYFVFTKYFKGDVDAVLYSATGEWGFTVSNFSCLLL